jgi:hypothetical protein
LPGLARQNDLVTVSRSLKTGISRAKPLPS